MAQPIWITNSGSLGTIQEGEFFQLPLLAYDPDNPTDNSELYFTLLSGNLPEGIQVGPTGLISGIPKAIANVQGVPLEVGENVVSKFSVRAYTKKGSGAVDRVNDRTFEITVVGQDVPEFTTPSGEIGRYFDGDFVSYQIQFSDSDPNDTVYAYVASGSLPAGLELSRTGLISGYIDPIINLDSTAIAGFDRDGSYFDKFPFDFSTRSINKSYQFTIKLTDGKEYRLRTFSIFVYSRDSMTADTIEETADTSYITADTVATRRPYIENYTANLGSYRHENFYAHQFEGYDPDGDQVEYRVVSGDLPPGLDVDRATGWLVGYIPNIGFQDITYSWTVRVYKKDNPTVSQDFSFTLVIYGNIDIDVTWLVNQDLGLIDNGDTSYFYVRAIHSQGIPLQYRLKSGSDSKLPQGLKLLPSGNIAGRVSYKTFALDGGTTTFDKDLRTRLDINETTFDMTFEFTVEAYNSDEIVNVSRTFTLTVNRRYNKPCQCMRIEAFPPLDDRELLKQLVQNQDIFRPEWIYRADDPWFGVRQKIWYEHAYGLEPSLFSEYVAAIVQNHYRKRIVLGEIKTALAKDDADNVLYEVVYAEVVDTQVNNDGESAAESVALKYPVNAGDSTEIDTIYPNSLENMRNVVIDNIGQVAPILPRWMLSKQEDGEILGFTRAWVIAYTVPGKSKQLAYRINEDFGIQLNKIDFDADRYVLGWYSANKWDSSNDEWLESRMTTFDRGTQGSATETVFDGGSTRFIYNVDIYEYTDVYDKYLLFPQRRIIDNEQLD
jgi:hypothetical protein